MTDVTLQEANMKLMEHIYSARGEDWFKTAKEIRNRLLYISRHPRTKPRDRAICDGFLCYSFKGVFNYQKKIMEFINSVKL